MSLEKILATKQIENPIKVFKSELQSIIDEKADTQLLTKHKIVREVAMLGLALLQTNHKQYDWQDADWVEPVALDSEKFHSIKALVKPNIWDDPDFYALLIYFLGKDNALLCKHIWNQLPYKMYQRSYSRRSFRAPEHVDIVLVNQFNFLIEALCPERLYAYVSNKKVYYQLSINEQICYDTELYGNRAVPMFWAAQLDLDNQEIYQLMEDIAFNKHPVGKLTRNIIIALLSSEKKACWQLVEKVLIAAQRQEGLRQTILEALDETSIGALKYMLTVILDHKLTRFSSVVRAIDTWTGLGWESEKESVVNTIVRLASHYLTEPELIQNAVKSNNNNEVYMALWAQGVLNIEQTIPYLSALIEKGTIEKKSLALKFAAEIAIPELEMSLYFKALNDDNLQVLAFTLRGMLPILEAAVSSGRYINHPDFPNFFEKLFTLTQTISVNEKSFEGKVFSWLTVKFDKNSVYLALIALVGKDQQKLDRILENFETLSLPIRERLMRNVLQDYSGYYYSNEKKEKKPIDAFQRQFALRVIKDRSEQVMSSAISALLSVELAADEMGVLQEMLKRKSSGLRKKLIALIIKQRDDVILPLIENTLETGDTEQRWAVLDIMLQLQKQNRLSENIPNWIDAYQSRKKLSEREVTFLEQFDTGSISQQAISADNGFGLYDPNKISPKRELVPDPKSFYAKAIKKHPYGFSMPLADIQQKLSELHQLFLSNQDYEYEIEYYDGSKTKVLLINQFRTIKHDTRTFSGRALFELYPLWSVWEQWYLDSGLQPLDLRILTLASNRHDEVEWQPILEPFVFYNTNITCIEADEYKWNHPLLEILSALQHAYSSPETNAFLIEACTRLFSVLPESVLQYKREKGRGHYYYYHNNNGTGWQTERSLNLFLEAIDLKALNHENIEKVWALYRWRQLTGRAENIAITLPPLYLFCKAYQFKVINQDELYYGLLVPEHIKMISSDVKSKHRWRDYTDYLVEFDFLEPMLERIREFCLDIEVQRGDSSTAVSQFSENFCKIFGINRFTELLKGLGKINLHKGYIYSSGDSGLSKQQLFSMLLKRCYPRATESQDDFNRQLDLAKIAETRLIEAAIYAPQWQKFVSNYLGWKGLDSAIWWMHAHTKTSSYQEQNAENESEIAKYSTVDLQDFKEGAVDKDWFISAYKQLGKDRWEILYDAAKYISDGNGHRRARLYADTMTGNLKIREVTTKIKDKRDQDYLRVYGLVPLNKTNLEKDVLTRYEYLQQFKKESKEFGSMKQTSEAVAVRIALENLARNANYPDPVRLTWAMETKQVQNILSKETQVQFDDITVCLEIDETGIADVIAYKDKQALKAIPAKLKKEKAILELATHKKTLRDQYKRALKGLEESMIRGDLFTYTEIANLAEHPVIAHHIKKLVFITSTQQTGFFVAGQLVSALGQMVEISQTPNDYILRIAHCVDLHATQTWVDYQSYCFDNEIKQPFKQVFRELYIPTADELQDKSISRRYAGHQVAPKQTLALLKTRGWKVDYETGLQKAFHKEGFIAKIYAMADWFSPADVESPTLETIEFHDLKEGKNVAFDSISPLIFSEVMRDIDLVVSVAHVGGVDPEASHSSIEMRAALLRESARLFKLNNVEIMENHVKIKGTLGEYSVHLGSAVVHQLPGRYLSILPVHSQHRGRLFLPFVDEDPKSAEVISKVLLLSRDSEIQDPTVLSQIERVISN